MDSGQDLPVTKVCIISDPTKLPPGYTSIDRTHDKVDDADLWKDGIFGRRVMRYLCMQRRVPSGSEDVLVDVALINERDEPPPGFMVLDRTQDSGEKATKKRLICFRWMVPTMTTDAITEIVFVNRTQRRAPVGYTMVGDINQLSLCYKMGRIPTSSPDQSTASQQGGQGLAYSMPSQSALPYNSAPPIPQRSFVGVNVQTAPTAMGGHMAPASPPINSNPLSGVQWKMNSRYSLMMELRNLTIPEIRGKTLSELQRQYEYSFEVESSVCS